MKLISQVVLVLAVVAAVAGGLLLLVRDSNSGGGIEIALPTATVEPVVELKVYVTGAVRDPGVYAVEQGQPAGPGDRGGRWRHRGCRPVGHQPRRTHDRRAALAHT